MLHIGHFSFDERDDRDNPRHGYFTCIIDAADPEEATAKFGDYILKMKKKEEIFRGVAAVYLEDIVKVASVPDEPVISWLQSSEGQFPKSVSHSLPAVVKDGIEAFGMPSNVDKHEAEAGEEYKEQEPFIRFDE